LSPSYVTTALTLLVHCQPTVIILRDELQELPH
jgi:hypothetical protein